MRLVIVGGVPSPWSQGAMGIFDMKKIAYVAVRFRSAAEQVRAWSGSHNAPVAVHDGEPPRTGWAEILALAERLGGSCSLVPDDDDTRVRMFGLAQEILGEGGLVWNVRLLLVHASLTTDGREGWPMAVAPMLATKYGYAPAPRSVFCACSPGRSRRPTLAGTTIFSERSRPRWMSTPLPGWVCWHRCRLRIAPCWLLSAMPSKRWIGPFRTPSRSVCASTGH